MVTNEELRKHENDLIAHFTNAAYDGCVCGLCEAVRQTQRQQIEDLTGIIAGLQDIISGGCTKSIEQIRRELEAPAKE